MSEELKVTKERVLAAARKCETANEVLKELFPEAFDKETDLTGFPAFRHGRIVIEVRGDGEYKGTALWLSRNAKWSLVTDSYGELCLVPTSED